MEPAHEVPRDVLRRYQRRSINTTLRHLYESLHAQPVPERLRAILDGYQRELSDSAEGVGIDEPPRPLQQKAD
jgi:hypothetical protein